MYITEESDTATQQCEKKTTRKKTLVLEMMRLLPVEKKLDFRAGSSCVTLSGQDLQKLVVWRCYLC